MNGLSAAFAFPKKFSYFADGNAYDPRAGTKNDSALPPPPTAGPG